MNQAFKLHTPETKPEAKPLFNKSVAEFGMLPNLHAVMGEQPALLDAYQTTWKLGKEQSGFTPIEQQVVYQASNVFNSCHYCVPAHSTLTKGLGGSDELIGQLALGRSPTDPKLAALHTFTMRMLQTTGEVGEGDLKAFFGAGYTPKHALSIVLMLACKVMSNYTNRLAQTPLDAPFRPMAEKLGVKVYS